MKKRKYMLIWMEQQLNGKPARQMNNGTRYVSMSECHVIRKNEGLVFC